MAIVNKVDKRVKVTKDAIIKYQIVTYCFLNDIDYLHRYGYIGLMIKSEYQGMGYGKITISFLCNLAKKNLNLIKVQASVVSLNTKSAQLFKKCRNKAYFRSC